MIDSYRFGCAIVLLVSPPMTGPPTLYGNTMSQIRPTNSRQWEYIMRIRHSCLAIWVLWKVYDRLRLSPLDNIAGPPSTSLLKGNFAEFFGNNTREYQIDLLQKYGSGVIKLKFVLGETLLLVSDPKALHSIVVKDQHVYEELPSFLIAGRAIFGPGLTSTIGEQHRKQRKILNPAFAISHLKEMVPIFYDVAYKLRDTIGNKVKEGPQEIELLGWMSRTALELIGQGGFGYSFDGLAEDSVPHTFAASVKRLGSLMKTLLFARLYLLPTLSRIGTPKLQRFMVRLLPWKIIREVVGLVDSIHDTSVDIIKSRKMALEEDKEVMEREVGRGKDIISVLLRANDQAGAHDKLSDEEIVAQVSIFTFAAVDTTSSALARTLWILAQRQDAQEKLRLEIREARKAQGDLAYDELMSLPYLDAVCRETLRLYPPVAALARTTRQDMVLPLGTPIKGVDGSEMHEIPVPKGTNIFVNVTACNNDPSIWGEDSYEWKPERWLQQLPESVSSARIPGVFSNLMTFLGGGRACIGFKFSQLEMKVVLLLLIESFKFSPAPGKEIYWQTQAIAKPATVGSSETQLPLVVERAH